MYLIKLCFVDFFLNSILKGYNIQNVLKYIYLPTVFKAFAIMRLSYQGSIWILQISIYTQHNYVQLQ